MNKYFISAFFCVSFLGSVLGQTTLSPGDLAIVYMNTDGDDDFGFVPFVDIASTTVIHFTERGYDAATSNLVTGTDGTITWTATTAVTAGTFVKISSPKSSPSATSGTAVGSDTWSLSGAGESIIVYQGTLGSPTTYIYLITTRGIFTAAGVSYAPLTLPLSTSGPGASTTINTNLPPGLTDGVDVLDFTAHTDNVQFKCVLTGVSLSDFMDEGNYNTDHTTTYSGAGTATDCVVATAPEINIKQSTSDIASGGAHAFGSVQIGDSKDLVFTVENTGDANLDIVSITPFGAGFSISSAISANPVSASGSATFTVRFTPSATSQTSGNVTIASNDPDEASYVINFTATVADAILSLKVFLEGPLSGSTMNTSLNAGLPTNPGTVYNSVLNESSSGIPATAVDWVEIELRTGTAAATKVGTNRAGILKSDGTVVDKDGNDFTMSQVDGSSYYIVVHHRNHLAVMSANAIAPTSGTYVIDFTDAQAKSFNNGSDGVILVGSVFAMIAGDADGDGDVDASDLTTWRGQNGAAFSYNSTNGDFNLDGVINAVDRNDFQQKNNTKTSQVPST
ncbi:MAG: choice-of-anchor D domain-containing protein [Roseivirga sp.]|nr:choice-of-anchor D domain-containing protein [Roseivirga sp.]